ncbi:LpqN/LpqT family lipoprotein [Mycolicibacterium thermoresistibile]
MSVFVRSATAVVAAVVVVLASAGCTRYVDDAQPVAADGRPAAADASQCTAVDAPLTTIPAHTDREPVLRIPRIAGWERSERMDSQLIRYAIGNPDIVAEDFVPNVVVTLESTVGVDDPDLAFEQQRLGLEEMLGATDLRVSDHTLCGLPAQTIDYLTPPMGNVGPHPATVLMVVMDTGVTVYMVTVTAQTFDPDDPTYRRDVDTMLSGFQVLPPSPA